MKRRTVCKLFYNNQVLACYKNKFCRNSSLKTDVFTHTNFLNKQDDSRKQDSSNKQVSSSKQNSSFKHDGSNNLKNVDPDFLR